MPEEKMNSDRVLTAYIELMINDRGDAANLSAAERDALRRILRREMDDAIDKALLVSLPEDKLTELEVILDRDGSDEELEAFFDTVGEVDADAEIEKAMTQVREDYLAGKIVIDLGAEMEREKELRREMTEAEQDETTVLQNIGDEPVMAKKEEE